MISWNWNLTSHPIAFVDFETASNANLRKVGSHAYVRDPSTRLLSAVWKVGGDFITWVPRKPPGLTGTLTGDAMPDIIRRLASTHTWVAHNAEGFDAMLWEALYPSIRPQWMDSMHLCRVMGLPASLDAASKALGGQGKDDAGGKIMKLLTSRPDAVGTVPLFTKLLHYNRIDVERLEEVWGHVAAGRVPRSELTLHSAINERGVMVDRAFAESLHATWVAMKLNARDEIAEATGGKLTREKASSGPAVHAWLKSVGIKVASLRKDFIATILDDPDALGAGDDETAALVSHVLRLRADVVRAGEGKVARLVGTLDADDRLRRMFVFHGAATGRFSSRVVQVHNLPRGVDGVDVEELCREPLTPERVRTAAGSKSPSDVLATLVRPCFVASPGRTLCIADFASVEARCVAWMAGETSLLATFAAGGDVYCDMASGLYGREITEDNKVERQVGKTIILGCIAKGTPILTSNGWKAIETVTRDDQVWDGVDWVSHDGVVDKGEKPVINVNGVWMTRDHEILTSKGWIEAWQVQEGTHTSPPVDVMENGRLSLLGRTRFDAGVRVAPKQASSSRTSTEGCQHDATDARSSSQAELRKHISDTLMCVRAPYCGSVYSTEYQLLNLGASTLVTETIVTTVDEVSRCIVRGSSNVPSSFGISCHYRGMTTRRLRLIESTTNEITSRVTCDLPLEASRLETVARTYDILNAGPRQRFQAGLLLVHNCGYQMGHANFARVCATQRIDLEAAGVTAEQCVKAYRERYPAIPKLWKAMQEAAMTATQQGGVRVAGRCSYAMRGLDLVCTLPSGRDIVYREARIARQVPRWAVLTGRTDIPESDCLVYQHHHGFAKELYGGLLTENSSQAISRDLLVDAALRYDATRTDEIVLHVHDELVAEAPEVEAAEALDTLCQIMSLAPPWAEDFPVEVKGFTGPRYVKSPFRDAYKAHYRGGVRC